MLKKGLNIAKIASLTLVSTTEKRLLVVLASRISKNKKTFIITPNPEFFVFARYNPWFQALLDKADMAIPDGVGLIWASKFLGKPIKERISGTDLMEKLCQEVAKRGWSIYLIGGKPGVAKETLEILRKRYFGLKGWAETGPSLELKNGKWTTGSKKGITEAVKEINAKKPDLLFVAFGMGKQEKFIGDSWNKLDVKLAMGIGGAFDYLSGEIPRAPEWMRKAGLEWFFRLFHQPWRWQRQLRLIEFVWLVFRVKLKILP